MKAIPAAREKGFGCLSVKAPMTGWRMDDVVCVHSVIRPIWVKVRANRSFSMG